MQLDIGELVISRAYIGILTRTYADARRYILSRPYTYIHKHIYMHTDTYICRGTQIYIDTYMYKHTQLTCKAATLFRALARSMPPTAYSAGTSQHLHKQSVQDYVSVRQEPRCICMHTCLIMFAYMHRAGILQHLHTIT